MNNPQPYPQPYGQQPSGQQQMGQMGTRTLNTGDAISVAWRHFSRQWVPWVLSMLAMMASMSVLGATTSMIVSATKITKTSTSIYGATQTTEPSGVGLVATAIFYIIMWVVAVVYLINSYRNAFRMTQGETIVVRDFFKLSGLGTPLIVIILCEIIVSIGMLLFIIPGIIAIFVLMYVPVAAVINNSTVGRAFSEGFAAFKNNIGQSILLVVLLGLITLGGLLMCIGGLVTTPLTSIALVVGFLVATGRNLVEPD